MNNFKWFCEKVEDTEKSREYRSWKTVYNKEGGFVEDDVKFEFIEKIEEKEPYICIESDNRMWVFLSPEQFLYLVDLLAVEEKGFIERAREYVKSKEATATK